jgi:Domain of unknown function (DUF5060)
MEGTMQTEMKFIINSKLIKYIGALTTLTIIAFITFFYLKVNTTTTVTKYDKPVMSKTAYVKQYEKFEVTYPYSGNYSNPADPSVVDVEAVFIAPGGSKQTVPGFYFQDYARSGNITKEILTPIGHPAWKIRYAPSESGTYTYTVTLTDANGSQTLGRGSLISTPSAHPGFIRAKGYQLQYDNGRLFVPLGINAPWFQYKDDASAWGDGTYGVDAMFRQLTTNGANFFNLWTCNWTEGQASPFAKPNIGCDGSGVSSSAMSQPDSWVIDYITDQASIHNIYYIPMLKFDDQTDFTAADKIKVRYFIARWGYSTNIVAWDFNKEGALSPTANSAWASYVNSIDSYQHLRTTSQYNHYPVLGPSQNSIYTQIFSDPLMTLVQTHDYTDDCVDNASSAEGDAYYNDSAFGDDPALALFNYKLDPSGTDPRDFTKFDKPSFFGETGVDACGSSGQGNSSYYASDPGSLILKSELWGMVMGSSGGYAPWTYKMNIAGTTQLAAFKGISHFVSELSSLPDTAALITSYKDDSTVTTSDTRLRVIGRKNSTFAMLFIQNTTGTPMAILRDDQTPTLLGGTITLKHMQTGARFAVTWYDTTTGNKIQTDNEIALEEGLTITLPQKISQNIAAIVTLA